MFPAGWTMAGCPDPALEPRSLHSAQQTLEFAQSPAAGAYLNSNSLVNLPTGSPGVYTASFKLQLPQQWQDKHTLGSLQPLELRPSLAR